MHNGCRMNAYTYDVQDYLRIPRERWRTIALVTFIVLLGSIAVTARGSSATPDGLEVVVPGAAPAGTFGPGVSPSPGGPSGDDVVVVRIFPPSLELTESFNVEGERLVALSERVLAEPARDLGLDVEHLARAVKIIAIPNADSLAITADEVGAVSGEQLARAVADSYLRQRSTTINRRAEAAAEALDKQLRLVRVEERSDSGSLVAALRVAALQSELARLQSKAASAQAGEILESASYGGLTATASPPPPTTAPASATAPTETQPSWTRNILAGLVLGLLLGYAVALVLDLLTPRFRSPREAREVLDLPILTKVYEPDSGEAVGELTAQIENGLRERGQSSLAWVEVGGDSKEVFESVTGLFRAGGAEVRTVEAGTDPAGESLARAEEAMVKMRPGCDAILVRAAADASSRSALAWAGACDTAVVALDLANATREEAQHDVGNLRRAGTEPMGLLLLA